MSEYKNTFQFSSGRFGPLESEEDETSDDYINPDAWARQLSNFLSDELKARGWKVLSVYVEDWGHYIALSSNGGDKEDAMVGCGNVGAKDGDDVSEGHLVFGDPHTSHKTRWFKKIDTSAVAQKIGDDLHDILEKCSDCTNLRRDYTNNLPV